MNRARKTASDTEPLPKFLSIYYKGGVPGTRTYPEWYSKHDGVVLNASEFTYNMRKTHVTNADNVLIIYI